jgi:ATP-dependent exoDNAse (exonuclease V) beta subunit
LTDLQYVVELVARNAPPLVVLPYRHIKHFLLDEAQDTSLLQWTVTEPLIEELLGNGYPVHIVGDPKQSIYSWRGAELSYFLELQSKGQKLFLSHNYRSKRRIIFFNNLFYQRVLNYLKAQVSKASSKNKIEASNYLIAIYTHHQQKRPRLESLGRARYKFSERRFFSLFRVRGYTHEAELGRSLRRALEILRRRGIPPHETAFLVRKNEEIGRLRQLLPEYALQIASHTLGEVPSLYATMELLALLQSAPSALEASPPPTSRLFLEQVGLFPLLKDTLLTSHWPDTPLDWWKAFYALAQGVRRHLPSEGLFWEAFLDHLWNFLEKQIAPTLSLILTWWEEKGHEIAVDIPLSPNTYPVLTIHKAKGLAWQAVIIPYADWGLFEYKAKAQWYSLHKILSLLPLSPTEKSAVIKFVDSLVKLPPSSGVRYHSELPLKVKSTDRRLSPLYAESLKNVVLENLNLHYVATTRPRQALFIYYKVQTKAEPSSFPSKWKELHKNLQERLL